MIDRLYEPGTERPTPNKFYTTEGTTCPIYDHEGELIKNVHICFDWCNVQGTEYEISDVRYGSIDGVILPEICDIIQAIQEKMGLHNSLTFPYKFHHEPKL